MAGETILVVDDEPHIRFVVERKLRNAGYHVVTTRDGRWQHRNHNTHSAAQYDLPTPCELLTATSLLSRSASRI